MSDLPPELPGSGSDGAALPPPDSGDGGWQPLPPRGAALAAFGGAWWAVPIGIGSGVLSQVADAGTPWLLVPAAGLVGAALGAWFAVKRHRRTAWKLNAQGFALKRGHWWQTQTHVPLSRVQHLDLKRGPLERAFGLATLVIHTAGTRMASVSVSGLDGVDAERLRDRLANQLDHGDAL